MKLSGNGWSDLPPVYAVHVVLMVDVFYDQYSIFDFYSILSPVNSIQIVHRLSNLGIGDIYWKRRERWTEYSLVITPGKKNF
jgi:hypothetical protein